MIQAATLPLVANRWTPFVYQIDVIGADLSAATFKAQVRLGPGTPGSPLVDLSNASLGAQGVYASGDATLSTITIRINEATMEALPTATEVGNDAVLWWDLHVTRAGHSKTVYFRGPFTVRDGATQ